MKHQGMACKGLIPSRCTVTAASHTTPAEIKWQNVHVATNGSIKSAKKLLIRFLSIKGSNGGATTAKWLRYHYQVLFFMEYYFSSHTFCNELCNQVEKCKVELLQALNYKLRKHHRVV